MKHYKPTDYEIKIFGITEIDDAFDPMFYGQQYPETNTYYLPQKNPVSDRIRLYHHYLYHGQHNDPPYCKNKSQFISQSTGLTINPPHYFDHLLYQQLYPNLQQYMVDGILENIIDTRHRMYAHYTNHGQQNGYAYDHKTVPIFYHIPKCGGTSIHYGCMLQGLRYQYAHHSDYYLLNINWLNSNNNLNILSTIHYCNRFDLEKITEFYRPHMILMGDKLYNLQVVYNSTNIIRIQAWSNLLALIINAAGFINANHYIKTMCNDRVYEKYLLMREPLQWHMSKFYYLRDVGTWENTHRAFSADMTFIEYTYSDLLSDSWLIRNMCNIHEHEIITTEHLDFCISLLNDFTHVGLLDHFDDFQNRLCQRYNWKHINSRILNKNKVSQYETIPEADKDFFYNRVKYDKLLYDYFKEKYSAQADS